MNLRDPLHRDADHHPKPGVRAPTGFAGLALALATACGPAADSGTGVVPASAGDSHPGTRDERTGLVLVEPHHPAHPGWVDFGTIQLGEVASRTVELVNREGRPLTIQNLQAGCACTIPSLAYRDAGGELVVGNPRSRGRVLTVPADATVELTISVDSRQAPVRNKPKRVNVRLVTDSDTDPYLTVEAQFFVEAPFRLGPERLDLGEVAQHGLGRGAVRIVPLLDIAPVAVTSAPPGIGLELVEVPFQGEAAWELRALAEPPVELGLVEHRATLSTRRGDGSDGPPLDVPIRITGVPDLQIQPARLWLRVTRGVPEPAEVVVRTNLPGHRFRVHSPTVEGDGSQDLTVALVPEAPGDGTLAAAWTVRLSPTPGLLAALQSASGDLQGVLQLELEGAEPAHLSVPYLILGEL